MRKRKKEEERERRGGKEGTSPSEGWWCPVEVAGGPWMPSRLCHSIGHLVERDREKKKMRIPKRRAVGGEGAGWLSWPSSSGKGAG